MNNVNLIGNLTRDPELLSGKSGKSFAKFNLAVNSGWGENKKCDFINCTAFGKTAEILCEHTKKGTRIGVVGKISTGKYDKDGRTIFTTDVLINELHFGNKNDNKKDSKTDDFNENDVPF